MVIAVLAVLALKAVSRLLRAAGVLQRARAIGWRRWVTGYPHEAAGLAAELLLIIAITVDIVLRF
jgi:hypothetical protein